MTDDNTVIEGTVKFRDGKKWKSRWCVMRKLSPVADCLHLQLYRDSKERYKKGQTKSSLSLQHYLGFESGFTLDKESNTIAIICQDVTVVLAFETRERLIQWQVKVGGQLGEPRHYLVMVGAGGGRRLPAGPARLHLHARRFALTAGVPPRLLGLWDLAHLRRYGVVEGRFCFEGGSHCGKGEGLHVLVTDQAQELTYAFGLAAQGKLSPMKRPLTLRKGSGILDSLKSNKAYRPDTRLSELNTIENSLPPTDIRLYEDPGFGEEAGAVSPYWPSAERGNFHDMGLGDTLSVNEAIDGTEMTSWNGSNNVTLERCMSCISKLGALSRSSTAALTPGATHFSPAWTMEAVHETTHSDIVESEYDVHLETHKSSQIKKCEEICVCTDRPPDRPPKPTKLELNLTKKPPMPLPTSTCSCNKTINCDDKQNSKIGPYENYDVPKMPFTEMEGEYYDTPKRLKECLNTELFKITKSSTSNSLVLKKSCGCLLKLGKKKNEPTIVDYEETFQPANCACQRVTNWANTWIKLPYCRRNTNPREIVPNKENMMPNFNEQSALYATVDVSRKTKRNTPCSSGCTDVDLGTANKFQTPKISSHNVEIDEGPLANYENLNFALSLEYYENAKDVLRKAGITQTELDAISANLNPLSYMLKNEKDLCTKCGYAQRNLETTKSAETIIPHTNDDYLMMEPNTGDTSSAMHDQNNKISLPSGYTPMSPISNFAFHTLKHPKSAINRLLDEKSASNPTLYGPSVDRSKKLSVPSDGINENSTIVDDSYVNRNKDSIDRIEHRKRSCSADSSRFLEDVKEFDGSVGSRGSSSSLETLRNMAIDGQRTSTPYATRDIKYCEDADCCAKSDTKNSDIDSSDTSKDLPQLRNKIKQGSLGIKRSSSVPFRAGPNRDSSSSNDSGVSSCSLRHGPEFADFELPLTTALTRQRYRSAQRRAPAAGPPAPPRRSKSTDPGPTREVTSQLQKLKIPAKSSSAEAEVPVLPVKPLRGVVDSRSTSSGTSDMSDYIETLSLCSSHSSTDTPTTLRLGRAPTSTLRPRSGNEYRHLAPRLAAAAAAAARPRRRDEPP